MTDNSPADGNAHPAAVALLLTQAHGARAFEYCSGVLISPTVVLTASHCDEGLPDPRWGLIVTNDPVLPPVEPDGWFDATALENASPVASVVSNPLYRRGYRDDVSAQVITRALPVPADQFPLLPAPGLLDQLAADGTLRSTPTTVLGYGTIQQTVVRGKGPAFPDSSERRSAVLLPKALNPQWLHQEQSLAKGQGGACWGDSGGPSLIQVNGRTTVVGVTSTGDWGCVATNVASRVDTTSALRFLAGVLAANPSS